MTYILGSRCSDGVVLMGDRKVILQGGSTSEYEDKLFLDSDWLVVGSSGVLALFEKFREKVTAFITSPDYDNMVATLIRQIEIITRELNKEYSGVLLEQGIDVLVGIKTSVGADVKYIYPEGFAEGVRRYKVIGHGEPYGALFLKQWWHRDMTMLEVAELGYFIIKYIENIGLDNTVGIGQEYPQIWMIPNIPNPKDSQITDEQWKQVSPRTLTSEEMADMKDKVSKRLANYNQVSWENLVKGSSKLK